jgi:hypothetical protein
MLVAPDPAAEMTFINFDSGFKNLVLNMRLWKSIKLRFAKELTIS